MPIKFSPSEHVCLALIQQKVRLGPSVSQWKSGGRLVDQVQVQGRGLLKLGPPMGARLWLPRCIFSPLLPLVFKRDFFWKQGFAGSGDSPSCVKIVNILDFSSPPHHQLPWPISTFSCLRVQDSQSFFICTHKLRNYLQPQTRKLSAPTNLET